MKMCSEDSDSREGQATYMGPGDLSQWGVEPVQASCELEIVSTAKLRLRKGGVTKVTCGPQPRAQLGAADLSC